MLTPKIRPQINDLPHSQRNKHAHGANGKPLDPLIGTLIRIAELHLPDAEKVHLHHHLLGYFTQPLQLRLDGAQLLAGLDGAPVLGVGADVDVELDCFGEGGGGVGGGEDVLEADVEGAVGVRGEGGAGLALHVAGFGVGVSQGVGDLITSTSSMLSAQCFPHSGLKLLLRYV